MLLLGRRVQRIKKLRIATGVDERTLLVYLKCRQLGWVDVDQLPGQQVKIMRLDRVVWLKNVEGRLGENFRLPGYKLLKLNNPYLRVSKVLISTE